MINPDCEKSRLTDLSQFWVPLYWNAVLAFSVIITCKFIVSCIYLLKWSTINKYNKEIKKENVI